MPELGDFVKFRDELWEEKRSTAERGGLFGAPLPPDHENKFKIVAINNQGSDLEPDFELLLEGFPWLVYFDEMEVITERQEKKCCE